MTKYRRGVDADMLRCCQHAMRKACGDVGAMLHEVNGEDDHVYLLMQYRPKVAVSALVNSRKGVPGKLRSEFTGRVNRHIMHGHFWSPSCLAASRGGAPLSIIRQHIEQQRHPVNATSGLTRPERRGLHPAITVTWLGYADPDVDHE